MPFYEYLIAYASNNASISSLFAKLESFLGYNILEQRTFNMWLLCSLVAYLSVCIICGSLDLIVPPSFKSQGSRSYFSVLEWYHALRLSLFNLLVSAWLVALPAGYIWKNNSVLVSESETMDYGVEALKYAGCLLTVEVWFYFTHYALHTPFLYSNVHKIHHRFKAPVAAASVYAHPIEFIVGNMLGVILGPILTNCHPITSYVWVFNALANTTGSSHSGHTIFGGKGHDIHHQYFDYNYGVGESKID
jgi:methylsterol monooxygenase